MKIKNLLLVCSLFLAGGVVATSGEQANSVREVAAATASATYNCSAALSATGTQVDSNISMKVDSTNTYSSPIRVYKNTTITFYGNSSDILITKITITAAGSSYYAPLTGGTWGSSVTTSSGGTNVGVFTLGTPASSITFKATSAQTRWSKVVIDYSYEENATSYSVSFNPGYTSFINEAPVYTADTGTDLSVAMPSASDLENDGKFYANCVGVTGWTTNSTTNEPLYELGETYTFNEKAILYPVYTQYVEEVSIATAKTICAETGNSNTAFNFSSVGTITSIDSAYNSTYKNITVTIDDGENSIKCYQLKGGDDLNVGTKIKVTGRLINYGGNTPEYNTGSTYEILQSASAESLFEKSLTTTKLTASYDVYGDDAAGEVYSYSFEKKQFSNVNETKTLNGASWTTDGVSAKGTHSYNYDSNSGRGQQFGTSTNYYTSFTLTGDEYEGVSIVRLEAAGASDTNAKLTVTVGGQQLGNVVNLTSANKEYIFSSSQPLDGEIVLSYTQTSKKALYLKSIEIEYGHQAKSFAVADASVGFASLIDEDAYVEDATYGILVVPTADLTDGMVIGDYLSNDLADLIADLEYDNVRVANYECEPVRVDANGDAAEDGEFYQFGVLFSNCLANIDFELTAVAYMEVNGMVHLTANETTYSLRSLAQAYIDSGVMAGNPDAVGVLNAIVNYGL